ncbi:MAG TPA: DinB family protein [Pyrinomonadaceae bacterium]|nr:DinB family protein [Pyrinomonadaceae bacterium]
MNNPESIITMLENAPCVIVPLVREVPAEVLKRRPLPAKWSAHEHACHLAEVQPMFLSRLELMLNDPEPRITPYQPGADDEAGALLKMDLNTALERFTRERAELVEELKDLSAEDWGRTAEHPEYAHYSVFIMFRHLALHDMLHSYRIEELLLKRDWEAE